MYEYIDENVERLKKQTQTAFNNFRLSLLKFDELNVMQVKTETESLFTKLKRQSDRFYTGLLNHLAESMGFEEDKYDLDELLEAYSGTLLYSFSTEMERKRERLFETMVAIDDMSDPEILSQQKKNIRNWNTQVEEFGDIPVPDIKIDSNSTASHAELVNSDSRVVDKTYPPYDTAGSSFKAADCGTGSPDLAEIQPHATAELRNLGEVVKRPVDSVKAVGNCVDEAA